MGDDRDGTHHTRHEIQQALGQAVVTKLGDLGIDPQALSAAHGRRVVRALVRLGARLARAQGWPLGLFLEVGIEAYLAMRHYDLKRVVSKTPGDEQWAWTGEPKDPRKVGLKATLFCEDGSPKMWMATLSRSTCRAPTVRALCCRWKPVRHCRVSARVPNSFART